MNILICLPSKLGDSIMAFPLLDELHEQFPDAVIDLILQKPLSDLHQFKNYIDTFYALSKAEYKGTIGLYRFGKMIRETRKYDLYITTRLSFSSALIGYFAGCPVRVGYKKEMRNFLLTHSYTLPTNLHNVEKLIHMFGLFIGKKLNVKPVEMSIPEIGHPELPDGNNLIFNVNSGAQCRRLPENKAVLLIGEILKKFEFNIILIGSPGEVDFVGSIEGKLNDPRVFNYAGKTSLVELAGMMKRADMVVSVDSGNSHLANCAGAKLILIWGGSGIESDIRPYNRKNTIIIKEDMPCAPCWPAETCKFGEPLCLVNTENQRILAAIDQLMQEK